MASDPSALLSFLDSLKLKQAEMHLGFGRDKVISFMGTSAMPGRAPSLSVHRLEGVETDLAHGAVAVRFSGAPKRRPNAGENVAIAVVDVPGYRGFQLKSPVIGTSAPASRAIATDGAATRITCAHVYTVRAEPSAASFFERIPFDDVAAVAKAVPHAIVAVGAQANVSPRFIYHWERADDGVALFHGDAFMNKTFYNVQRNSTETRLVLDLDGFAGYALDTRIEEADPHRDRAVVERIAASFAAAGFRANRVYRVVATDWRRVGPSA